MNHFARRRRRRRIFSSGKDPNLGFLWDEASLEQEMNQVDRFARTRKLEQKGLRRTLVRVPAGLGVSIEHILTAELFRVLVENGAHSCGHKAKKKKKEKKRKEQIENRN